MLLAAGVVVCACAAESTTKTAANDLDRMFDYDPASPLDVQVISEDRQKGYTVLDLTYASPLGGRAPAYVILPNNATKQPAVIFAHWMMDGSPLRNRGEFLDEAKVLAQVGVVSLLIDAPQVRKGFVPGATELESLQRDADAARQLAVDVRRGIDLLLARYPVDTGRIAFVGHSFGAHVGGILSAVEKRIQSFVLMAGAFSDEAYVFDPESQAMRDFRERVGDDTLRAFYARTRWDDPISFVGRSAPAAVYLQFGSNDDPIPVAKARGYFTSFAEPKAVSFHETGHALDASARVDRVNWLAHRLRLPPIDQAAVARIPQLR
jgi:dienelactone hydrolase